MVQPRNREPCCETMQRGGAWCSHGSGATRLLHRSWHCPISGHSSGPCRRTLAWRVGCRCGLWTLLPSLIRNTMELPGEELLLVHEVSPPRVEHAPARGNLVGVMEHEVVRLDVLEMFCT
uniref:Uncharacterized protein n=1 Tax=Aegilops tauschii subsp. strangulata TaxID=200361 RepID=A0A453NXK0_AEGTS